MSEEDEWTADLHAQASELLVRPEELSDRHDLMRRGRSSPHGLRASSPLRTTDSMPDWCIAMLVGRHAKVPNPKGPIFPSLTGTIREASNVRNRVGSRSSPKRGDERGDLPNLSEDGCHAAR